MNTLSSTSSSPSGSRARRSFTQFSKAPAPIRLKRGGKFTACRIRQSRNAPAPIISTESGRITLSTASFPAKASSAMRTTPSGTTTLDSLPRYFSRTVPLRRKFPRTCRCTALARSGVSSPERLPIPSIL